MTAGWITAFLLLALPGVACAQGGDPLGPVRTFVYKKAAGVEIELDVYRPEDEKLRPVVVWIHGGALINGGRQGVSGRVKRLAADEGFVLVSIDYRLAPETKLPAIVEDLEDAFKWVRANGERLFRADTGRIVVTGGSAGGHLALTSGFRVDPPPTAVVSFWGYGDIVGPWLSEPSPHARHRGTTMSKEEARHLAAGPPVANAADRAGDGGAFYQYCRRSGSWPEAVSGFDPSIEGEKFVPFMAVRNVTEKFPPTLLIHGTKDTDVPFAQSEMMAAEFAKKGVEHRLIAIEGGEHGLQGGAAEEVEQAFAEMAAFVVRHLRAK